MIATDYELSKPLQTALKAKSPFVGIPIPGHAPLIFNRDKLRKALMGTKPVNVEVLIIGEGNTQERFLVVDGVAGPRCRTRMKMRSIQRRELLVHSPRGEHKVWEKWTGQKNAPKAPKRPQGKHQKALEKLEKQLAKLGPRPQIANPAVQVSSAMENHETWSKWKAQRRLRGHVGRLAKLTHEGKMDSRKLYQRLRELPGLDEFKTYSALSVYDKRSVSGFFDYCNPKTLWKFCGLSSWNGRPWTGRGDDDYGQEFPKWGPKRYRVVLEWIQERKEIISQIEAVKQMMIDVEDRKASAT